MKITTASIHRSLLVFLLLLIATPIMATHNRSGEILYKRVAPFTKVVAGSTVPVYTYSITVIRYTDHGIQIADRCADTVSLGDGNIAVAMRVNGNTNCNCGSGACGEIIVNYSGYVVKKNVYSVIHTYLGPGTYIVSSSDPKRNEGIENIANSVDMPHYIESVIIINPYFQQNSSPVLQRYPIDFAYMGQCFSHNPCAYDEDGDSLSYEITSCRGVGGQVSPGYSHPPGNYSIHPVTGQLNWCNPSKSGEYALALIVTEWRKDQNCQWQKMGSVLRDMQVLTSSYPYPDIIFSPATSNTCITAGDNFIETFSATVSGTTIPLSRQMFGSSFLPTDPGAPVFSPSQFNTAQTATVSWNTTCTDILPQPQQIYLVFTSTVSGHRRTFYKTINVRISPRAPQALSFQLDTNQVKLQWNIPQNCQGITGYQIYRKNGSHSGTTDPCIQGATPNSGFSLVGSVTGTQYIDNNFWGIANGSALSYFIVTEVENCTKSGAGSVVTPNVILGMADIAGPGIVKIYPNPFNDEVRIDYNKKASSVHIRLYSVDGKCLFDHYHEPSEMEMVLHTGDLPSGFYFLSLTEGDVTFQKKILKP